MYRVTYGSGQYQVGETHVLLEPAGHRRDGTRPLVVIAHGLSGTSYGAADVTVGGHIPVALARAGFVVLCIDAGGPATWANNAAMTAVANAITYGQGAVVNAQDGKVFLGGLSMGALVSLAYAADHPTDVAGVWGAIPAVDLNDIHANNLGGNTASINTAYTNLAGYQAAEPTRNPAKRTADLAQVPMWLQAAENDPVARWTPVQTFAAATGAHVTNLGNVGHSFTAADAHTDDVIRFMRRWTE